MRDRRVLIAIAATIAPVLAVCLIVGTVFSFSAGRHESVAFNDSDLIPTRSGIPIESNAFWTLSKATNELYWPELLERKLSDLSDNTNWDDSLAADALEKNRACLEWFDESFQQLFLLVPEPKTLDEDYPYLSGWKTISRVESIRVVQLFRARKEKEAFDSALKIIGFGQRVENCGGSIIHYLVGSAIKTIGMRRIQQMTAQTDLEEADLLGLIHRLDNFKADKEGLTNALKVEYQLQCRLLNDIAAGKFSRTNSAWEQFAIQIGLKMAINKDKTRMEFAQTTRVLLNGIPKPFCEIQWSELPVMETNAPTWQRMLKGNAIGDILFQLTQPSSETFAARKCQENVTVTATQLILALKIYKMRHGKLPEFLSELVPEFFPRVPADDFDGKPLRYSPDKKIIYSVGRDLKDSGGESLHSNPKNYDLPFKIEF